VFHGTTARVDEYTHLLLSKRNGSTQKHTISEHGAVADHRDDQDLLLPRLRTYLTPRRWQATGVLARTGPRGLAQLAVQKGPAIIVQGVMQTSPALTVAFVIDTSVGMLQRNHTGFSVLDRAKAAVRGMHQGPVVHVVVSSRLTCLCLPVVGARDAGGVLREAAKPIAPTTFHYRRSRHEPRQLHCCHL